MGQDNNDKLCVVGEMRNRFSRSYQTVLSVCTPSPPSPSPLSSSSPLRSPSPAPSLWLHLCPSSSSMICCSPSHLPSLVPWTHRQFVDDGDGSDDGNYDERRYNLESRSSSSMLDEEHIQFLQSSMPPTVSRLCHFSYDQRCKRQDIGQHPLKR